MGPFSTAGASRRVRRRAWNSRFSPPVSRRTCAARNALSIGGAASPLRTRSLRRTGSTALNLAYLAAGRFDGYWAFDNHVWDVAGGMVLVTEAGGILANVDGSPFDPFTPDCLASNGPLQPALLAALRTGP